MNWFVDTLSITIGMNLWLFPQISEHCPYRWPGRLTENLTSFNRPGVASVFTPSLGIVHVCCCYTSAAVTIIQIGEFMGSTVVNIKFEFNWLQTLKLVLWNSPGTLPMAAFLRSQHSEGSSLHFGKWPSSAFCRLHLNIY